jgi:pimeloyl-ACP methyl ester carboxylesterase
VPTVVVQGDHDELVKPKCGRELAARIPGARLEMLGGSHMQPYTHPAAVAAAVAAVANAATPTPARRATAPRAHAAG